MSAPIEIGASMCVCNPRVCVRVVDLYLWVSVYQREERRLDLRSIVTGSGRCIKSHFRKLQPAPSRMQRSAGAEQSKWRQHGGGELGRPTWTISLCPFRKVWKMSGSSNESSVGWPGTKGSLRKSTRSENGCQKRSSFTAVVLHQP